MKYLTTVVREYTIILTAGEYEWLKGVMQNPLHGETPDQESEINKKYRRIFWDALNREN